MFPHCKVVLAPFCVTDNPLGGIGVPSGVFVNVGVTVCVFVRVHVGVAVDVDVIVTVGVHVDVDVNVGVGAITFTFGLCIMGYGVPPSGADCTRNCAVPVPG